MPSATDQPPKLDRYDLARDFNPETDYYDAAAADHVVDFFRVCLSHTQNSVFSSARDQFELAPWQAALTRAIYGVKRRDTGRRRFRTVYVEIPRKNGKTTLAAGYALYSLFGDGEDGAQCYCAAADRNQASLLFDAAAQMTRQKPALSGASRIIDSKKRIIYRNSFLAAISSEAHSKHGFNSHFIVADEMHAWKGRELWDVLSTSTGARPQPLIIILTTAGWDRQSVCYELHQYAAAVRDGTISDPSFLPVIYAADPNDDWTDPKTWKKANPNYGVSLSPEYMTLAANQAKANPAAENSFRRLHLNQWTQQTTRWLTMADWHACPKPPETAPEPPYAAPYLDDLPIVGGLDLSSTTDFTAWTALQRAPETGVIVANWRFWLPADTAAILQRRHNLPIEQWTAAGWLQLTPLKRVDYRYMLDQILADAENLNIRQIGVDPWSAAPIMQELAAAGLDAVAVRQGAATLSAPCHTLETAIAEHKLHHGFNPVATWHAENVEVHEDTNGNLKPLKPKSGNHHKIDGVAAALNALAVLIHDQTGPALDYYSTNPVEVL